MEDIDSYNERVFIAPKSNKTDVVKQIVDEMDVDNEDAVSLGDESVYLNARDFYAKNALDGDDWDNVTTSRTHHGHPSDPDSFQNTFTPQNALCSIQVQTHLGLRTVPCTSGHTSDSVLFHAHPDTPRTPYCSCYDVLPLSPGPSSRVVVRFIFRFTSYLFHCYAVASPLYFYFVTCFSLLLHSPQSLTRC
jgi:hypothetical protein